jgi:hypothetical protein
MGLAKGLHNTLRWCDISSTVAAAFFAMVWALYCRPGVLAFNYCVAYTVADPVSLQPTLAGQALAQGLAGADAGQAPRTVLPVLLASSHAPVVADFSQGKSIHIN